MWTIIVPDGKRLGHVNKVCVRSIHMWAGRGEKVGKEDCARGQKMGLLTLSMGSARAEVCSYVQRATIPSKKVILYSLY
jgi:hypothetical protein